jgi:hypothetical protein
LSFGVAALLVFACKTNNINATTNNEADTFSVGPAAQDLVGPDNVEVDVPANAVTTTIQVTLSVEATGFPALPSGATSAGNVYSFEPAGQTFAASLTVKIPYKASGSGTPTLLTAEDSDPAWTTVSGSTTVSTGSGTFLSAQTTHFSFYTVVMASGEADYDSSAPTLDGGTRIDSSSPDTSSAGEGGSGSSEGPPLGDPTFSPPSGDLTSGSAVTIKLPVGAPAGAQIYYTTNGSVPTPANANLYSGPIEVLTSEPIIAIAHDPTGEYSDSSPATANYVVSGVPEAG